ncbi:unnamed protein product [Polarella glacialis]|uniref:Uncharacterized protein n=1 Tax=Polarella glacialis TaxID=89957 RepID=A0A813KYN9_POLGL|nr:unnamed protein product [Polarella glacialis]
MSRLGGGSGFKQLGREERLERLLASKAFGGAPLCTAPSEATSPGPRRGDGPAPATRPSSASRGPPAVAVRSSRPASAGAGARRQPGTANIHTIGSSGGGGGSGSRLHQTTEAYRQNRGTTARTVEEVGYDSMTAEKAAQVDRARAKVHGEAGRQPRPRSGAVGAVCKCHWSSKAAHPRRRAWASLGR